MANNGINEALQTIINLANNGKTPNEVMGMLMQQNPQIKQSISQLQNMAQGRDMKDFVMQLMKQNTGIDPVIFQNISKMLGGRK